MDRGSGQCRQGLRELERLAPDRLSPQRQHLAELRHQTSDTVDGRRALLHEALPGPVQRENRLLLRALYRYKPHARSRYRLANRFRIVAVVLAAASVRP